MTSYADPRPTSTHRLLVVADHLDPENELVTSLLAHLRDHLPDHADHRGDLLVRLVVLNPARAEAPLLHPERHARAEEAERALLAALPRLQQALGRPVLGSVSVRHDPMDAIEEVLDDGPYAEVLLAVPEHRLAVRLHQDLPHRLARLGIPVSHLRAAAATG